MDLISVYALLNICLHQYSHVQGILDTGMTVSKLRVISSSEYARRRDEIFFRVTRRQVL